MPTSGAPTATRRLLLTVFSAAGLTACGARGRRSVASVPRPTPTGPATPVAPTQAPLALGRAAREAAVARAALLINTPYRYGGNTPEGGFDCSGLVHYVLSGESARLPRSTAQWAAVSAPVAAGAERRGDLVFFNTSGAPFSHMGIYLGQDQFLHAPATGGTVRVNRLSERYFASRFSGARSVFGD